MKIEKVDATGEAPGWISEHKASLQNDTAIVISGGKRMVEANNETDYVDNHSTYQICLKTNQWEKLN